MGASRNKSDMIEGDWIWSILRDANVWRKCNPLGGLAEEDCRQDNDRSAEEEQQKADGGLYVRKGRIIIYWLYRWTVYLISYGREGLA